MKYKILIIVILFTCLKLSSVDNPNAPDYLGKFRARMKIFEEKAIDSSVLSEVVENYRIYENELDKELNKAYKLLMKELKNDEKKKLKLSQLKWIQYRDSEFEFIEYNFYKIEHGSFAHGREICYSVGAYRTTIIKDRIELLYSYLLNY